MSCVAFPSVVYIFLFISRFEKTRRKNTVDSHDSNYPFYFSIYVYSVERWKLPLSVFGRRFHWMKRDTEPGSIVLRPRASVCVCTSRCVSSPSLSKQMMVVCHRWIVRKEYNNGRQGPSAVFLPICSTATSSILTRICKLIDLAASSSSRSSGKYILRIILQ